MSSSFGAGRRQMMLPAAPPGRPIATYRTYMEAQRAVDYLSDEKFEVRYVSIVGTDLKMVERVTGRLTYARVALAGTFTGAYLGAFFALLLVIFDPNSGFGVALPAILIGCAFGMIFAIISYAFTGGRRDFTSTSQIVAAQYAVWCADEHAAEATRVLGGLSGSGNLLIDPRQQAPSRSSSSAGQPPPPQPQERMAAPPPPGREPTGQPAPPAEEVTYSEMLARRKAERERRTPGDEG